MLGSYAWIQKTRGKISLKEKLYLLQKTLAPTTRHLIHRAWPSTNTRFNPLNFDTIPIADTLLVKAAIEQLEDTQNIAVIYHSWRSYFWGVILGQIYGWQYDSEAFLIAALLHDIGLGNEREPSNCQCFTLNSATQANQLCQQHHYPKSKIDLITDAICMHMNGFSDLSQPKEIIMLQKGTSCDVIGSELYLIHPDFQKRCLENYPRQNFNTVFKALIQQEAHRHPNSRAAFLSSLGLKTLIQLNLFEE